MPKFTPRQRKHRTLAKAKAASSTAPPKDPNTIETPTSTLSSKQALLKSYGDVPGISSKKRKRLAKYVETKLRKEETLQLIKRLEERSKGFVGSLLQSSRKLGRSGAETRREGFERALRERAGGVRVGEAEQVLYRRPLQARKGREDEGELRDEVEEEEDRDEGVELEEAEEEEDEEEEEEKTVPTSAGYNQNDATGTNLPSTSRHIQQQEQGGHHTASQTADSNIKSKIQPPPPPTAFGSGLKRPLELDANGKPIIQTRKRRRTGPLVFTTHKQEFETEQPEWSGFSDEENEEDEEDEEPQPSDDQHSEDETVSESEAESGSEEDVHSKQGSSASEDEHDNESDSEAEPTSSAGSATIASRRTRTSAFKAWADEQRNAQINFTPSTQLGDVLASLLDVTQEMKDNFVPRPAEQDPLPESLLPAATTSFAAGRKAYAVPVTRTADIQAARLNLPVLAEEQRIMEAVFANDVVIVSGATGSGKTTQVPQFLYEYGFGPSSSPETRGMIGITQPRRVAAVSMARRVSEELGDHGRNVAHQIRFDSTVGKATALKFMTDGVLLREMSEDFSLRKYSAIIIDEAHERTVNTDILISLMSRCINIRRTLSIEQPATYQPLKLVIMSATLRVEDFRNNTRLFPVPPPIVEAEGRQFDVKVHWSRRTGHDYVEEAFKKVSRGHKKLPAGGMLVFLTGQVEIRQLMERLRGVFESTEGGGKKIGGVRVQVNAKEMVMEEEDFADMGGAEEDRGDEVGGDEGSETEEDPDAEFVIEGEEPDPEGQKIHLLPLYSQLPSKEQLKVFQPPAPGSRLIILATNVAETSLTIPGIRYVIDCGRHKQRTWDRAGVQTFRTTWISKASADQRSGRAGRTGPGHCYRLYSSAVFEDTFPSFSPPEITRANLEGVVLQLKGLGVDKVVNFPWPTPPDQRAIVKAENLLRNLGATDALGKITTVGKEIGRYPLSPRFALMLRLGILHNVAAETVALVAALDVPELFVSEQFLDLRTPSNKDEVAEDDEGRERRIWTAADDARESERSERRKLYANAMARFSRLDFSKEKVRPQSDAVKLLAAVLDYSTHCKDERDQEAFCNENFLREKGMREVHQLQSQLTNIVAHVAATITFISTDVQRPREKTVALLKQILAAGFIDQVAIRADLLPSPPDEERKPKRAMDVRYKTLFSASDKSSENEEDEDDGFVYIHPSSLLARLPPPSTPRYIVYQRLQRSQPSRPGAPPRIRMHPLTPVSGEQLSVLARGTALLEVGKPLGKIAVLERGVGGEERRECDVMLSLRGVEGGTGWPLRRGRVVQRRKIGRGWEVEVWK